MSSFILFRLSIMTGLGSSRFCQDIRHMLSFLILDRWFQFQKTPICGGVMLLKPVCSRRECGKFHDLCHCMGYSSRVYDTKYSVHYIPLQNFSWAYHDWLSHFIYQIKHFMCWSVILHVVQAIVPTVDIVSYPCFMRNSFQNIRRLNFEIILYWDIKHLDYYM